MARPRTKSYYELLEVEPSATEEEVRRAYRRLKEMYSLESPAVYGAYPRDLLEKLLRAFDEAHVVLMDAEKRKIYDAELQGQASAAAAAAKMQELRVQLEPEEQLDQEGPVEDLIGPEAEFNGELLRKIRQRRGISLEELATRTKVKSSYLKALEDEEWDLLPASVYVRGFLQNFARELKLEPQRVVASYFPRLKEHYDEQRRE